MQASLSFLADAPEQVVMLRQRGQYERPSRRPRVMLEDCLVHGAEEAFRVGLYLRRLPAVAMVHR